MLGRYFIFVAAIFLAGCASTFHVQYVDAAFLDFPKIERLVKDRLPSRTAAENIEAYYFWWNPLQRPDAIKDWKEIFIMGESSAPAWAYTSIANIDIAQIAKDDATAMRVLRPLASDLGGDALIDLRRRPMIDRSRFGNRIMGFQYSATVVRRNP